MTYRSQMKELIEKLRYAQMQMRIDLMSVESSKKAVKEIAKKMRQLQKENNDRTH